MDDDFEEYEESTGFEPGDIIVVNREDDVMVGVLLALNPYGVHLKVTQHMETVDLKVSEESEDFLRKAYWEESKLRLRIQALRWKVRLKDMLKMDKEELVEVCLVKTIRAQLDAQPPKSALVKLATPIKTFIPDGQYLTIESAEDYHDEVILRGLETDWDLAQIGEGE